VSRFETANPTRLATAFACCKLPLQWLAKGSVVLPVRELNSLVPIFAIGIKDCDAIQFSETRRQPETI
jgi:hypothetical protein